ncbi:GH92 family glycosyl hydrolase [Flavivirga sp. 57AJ16]|uniref:GH92 family glycosyl hydrolase n=1 Tax=Flavivirga sp. 57AJ16 TaxID=3025307 RepID=UPI002365E8CE|nr:GH92 family glycosyl hydrolase [Flavivirga sp. 57AJ16]MDD7885464.1 GH92 family glycosyl hydrolase [Flavivirga sp. 57AJ16]
MTFSLCFFLMLTISCQQQKQETVKKDINYAGLVYPQLDTENSRWFFFSSACRPFGLVNLSPDTEIDGAWGSGYRYKVDTIKGFSHIHAWQLSGLSMMPVDLGKTSEKVIYEDYFSKFDHGREEVAPGYHKLHLERYNIGVELTSTKRVGFHQYHFNGKAPAILINLSGQLGPSKITDGSIKQIESKIIEGELTNAPTRRRPKPTKVFFRIELDRDVKEVLNSEDNGKFLLKLDEGKEKVKMKVALSYTSLENAKFNLDHELPHWDFDQIVEDSQTEWNGLLGRIKVEGGTDEEQQRFYTDLWHALQGRRIINDANGYYPDNTGDSFKIKQLPLSENGEPLFDHYNSDSFWGAQWTINTLWQLVYPEIAESFTNSLLQYYQDGGLVPRGPAGGNYTYVMTGASSTPFIIGAYQKGISRFNLETTYEALKKNHMPGGIMTKAGYEHKTTLGGGLNYYIKEGYVPYPIPEGHFGYHQNGSTLTLEYAYQDWCLAQFAKSLDKIEDYDYFMARSKNYQNVFDPSSGWMRPKNVTGEWLEPYDPYKYNVWFTEASGAQNTWFVPHDLEGLAELMGGKDEAIAKLNRQFEEAKKLGFTSGTSHAQEQHPEYSRIPINYGNQPSIQTAFIFQNLGRPDLTQYWSKEVVNTIYKGLTTSRGYNGDEDQGLMGSLAVLMKIGLFQMTGGTEINPVYQITGPTFDRVEIELNKDYYKGQKIVIETENNSKENCYIKTATFNDQAIENFNLGHAQLVNGGILKLGMSPQVP